VTSSWSFILQIYHLICRMSGR